MIPVIESATANGGSHHTEFVERGEEALGLAIDDRAFLGQRKPGTTALAQPDPKPLLERGDVGADGRHTNVEVQLRGGKSIQFHHRGENPEQSKIDVRDPLQAPVCLRRAVRTAKSRVLEIPKLPSIIHIVSGLS